MLIGPDSLAAWFRSNIPHLHGHGGARKVGQPFWEKMGLRVLLKLDLDVMSSPLSKSGTEL